MPWGSEYVLEGRILARQREVEGPFGEFPGYYSGCHLYPVIEIDRVLAPQGPDLRHGLRRPAVDRARLPAGDDHQRADLRRSSRTTSPRCVAVNALYTHGLVVMVSTKTRYGGFAKAVGMRLLTTTARSRVRQASSSSSTRTSTPSTSTR